MEVRSQAGSLTGVTVRERGGLIAPLIGGSSFAFGEPEAGSVQGRVWAGVKLSSSGALSRVTP
jgi:hypothetical protein